MIRRPLSFFFLLATIPTLFYPNSIFSANYGENSYGSGTYNNNETSPTISPTPFSTPTVSSEVLGSQAHSGPTCTDQPPGDKIPWLYSAIANNYQSVTLYFTESDLPVSKYILEFGTKSGQYEFGSQDLGVNQRHQMYYKVNHLRPNTVYYFRLRAQNGCSPGKWSNEISAKTTMSLANNFIQSGSLISPSTDKLPGTSVDEARPALHSINIRVIDQYKKPVVGAIVAINEQQKTDTTDQNGTATINGLPAGNHRIDVSFGQYQGTKSLFLQPGISSVDIQITVNTKGKFNLYLLSIIGSSVLIVSLTFVWQVRRRPRNR